eukprot:CAMPEP_0119116866 /NCGR_PEP_ID=MMETSP1180-20130426/52525_1 /TAXON_ID=3052 ORGANISM="Chlamydomonas cf sp, Strain CCMP681" /NCGR_SAMPLE_ID=MMETSP1180 /ASSEMBLY_ACC=CAM_ASM_000741 /LENGTH=135 /DNA_ID=CAMNT_0007106061 /DNA_START=427 /DNA_END=834 /DNA_ORIENTATION=-
MEAPSDAVLNRHNDVIYARARSVVVSCSLALWSCPQRAWKLTAMHVPDLWLCRQSNNQTDISHMPTPEFDALSAQASKSTASGSWTSTLDWLGLLGGNGIPKTGCVQTVNTDAQDQDWDPDLNGAEHSTHNLVPI